MISVEKELRVSRLRLKRSLWSEAYFLKQPVQEKLKYNSNFGLLRLAVICSRHSYKSSPAGEIGRCFVLSEKRYELKPISTVTLFKFVSLLPECYPKLSLDGFNPFLQ